MDWGRNPKAPPGSGALKFSELRPDMKIIIHRFMEVERWTEGATVLAVHRSSERVSLRYSRGDTDTEWAADMGLMPDYHGWQRSYTTKA